MNKKIFAQFALTAVFLMSAFFVAVPANAQASNLWGAASETLGANASASAIMSLAKGWAIRFDISVPEWGIPGTKSSRQLPKNFLQIISGAGTASAQAAPLQIGTASPNPATAGVSTTFSAPIVGDYMSLSACNFFPGVSMPGETMPVTVPANIGPMFNTVVANYSYASAGIYTAVFKCSSPGGLVNGDSVNLTVSSGGGGTPPPSSSLAVSTLSINNAGVPVAAGVSVNYSFNVNSTAMFSFLMCNINWGDTTTSSAMMMPSSGLSSSSSISHTYMTGGTYNAVVSCNDMMTPTLIGSSTTPITVTGGAAPSLTVSQITPISATANVSSNFNFTVSTSGTFSMLTCTVNWGDTFSSSASVMPMGSTAMGNASHSYTSAGPRSIIVNCNDMMTMLSGSSTTPITVSGGTGSGLTVSQLSPISPALNVSTNFNFSVTTPNGAFGMPTCTVNWGDTFTSSASVMPMGSTAMGSASHTYTSAGPRSVVVNCNDLMTMLSGTSTTPINVTGAAGGNLIVSQLSPTTATTNTPTNFNFSVSSTSMFSMLMCTVNWGDGQTSSPLMMPSNGLSSFGSASHAYTLPGPKNILINCNDMMTPTLAGSSTTPINVTGASSLVVGNVLPTTVAVNTSNNFIFTVTDSGVNPQMVSCSVVSWGDGSMTTFAPLTSGAPLPGMPTTYTGSASHTYLSAGPYGIIVQCADAANGTSLSSTTPINVTGGGTVSIGSVNNVFTPMTVNATAGVSQNFFAFATPMGLNFPSCSFVPGTGAYLLASYDPMMGRMNINFTYATPGTYQAHFECMGINALTIIGATTPVNVTSGGGGGSTPSFSKSFMPMSISAGGISTLTITLNNPAPSVATLFATFADPLPTGMVISAMPNASTTCGGTGSLLADAGSNLINLPMGRTIPANGSCTITVNVTAANAGSYLNTIPAIALATSNGNSSNSASATLSVSGGAGTTLPPTITKSFSLTTVSVGQPSALSFFISNPNPNTTLNNVSFQDNLPTNVSVDAPNALFGNCGGGIITATPGSQSISLSGATLLPNVSCSFSVNVKSLIAGVKVNTTNNISSSNGGIGGTATATLTVTSPLTVGQLTPTNVTTGINTNYSFTVNSDSIIPSCSVGWGESAMGGNEPATIAPSATPGTYLGSISHAYNTSRVYTATVDCMAGVSAHSFTQITASAPVCPAVTLSPASLPDGQAGVFYSQTISASGSASPYAYTITSGAIPAGLILGANGTNLAGLLIGTPRATGTYNFTVTAADGASCTGLQAYTLNIANPTPPAIFNFQPTPQTVTNPAFALSGSVSSMFLTSQIPNAAFNPVMNISVLNNGVTQTYTTPVTCGAVFSATEGGRALSLIDRIFGVKKASALAPGCSFSTTVNLSQGLNVITESVADIFGVVGTFEKQITLNSTHVITASSGANGSVTPAGATTVAYDASQAYTIMAVANYHIADVLVDGVSVGAVAAYTFSNVVADHTISATFAVNDTDGDGVLDPVDECPAVAAGKLPTEYVLDIKAINANGGGSLPKFKSTFASASIQRVFVGTTEVLASADGKYHIPLVAASGSYIVDNANALNTVPKGAWVIIRKGSVGLLAGVRGDGLNGGYVSYQATATLNGSFSEGARDKKAFENAFDGKFIQGNPGQDEMLFSGNNIFTQLTVTGSSDYYNVNFMGSNANFNGCPFGDRYNIIVHKVNQLKDPAICGTLPNGKPEPECKVTPAGVVIKTFNRDNADFIAAFGAKKQKTNLDVIFASGIGLASTCITDASGSCLSGEASAGKYLAIAQYTDRGVTAYKSVVKNHKSKKVDSEDDDNDGEDDHDEFSGVSSNLIVKNMRFEETIKKTGETTINPGKMVQYTGSLLTVIYPEYTVWEGGVELYPFIMTSDSDWATNVCLQVPEGYSVAAVYDEDGNALPTDVCQQTFVSGETKIILFSVADIGSPEPEFSFTISTTHQEATGEIKETSETIDVGGIRQEAHHEQHSSLVEAIAPIVAKVEAEKKAEELALAQTTLAQAPLQIIFTFNSNLTVGSRSEDVRALQIYLNTHGFLVASTGPGSRGSESTYFGARTKAALKAFQEAHKEEILASIGLRYGTGIFGARTRAYINAHQ